MKTTDADRLRRQANHAAWKDENAAKLNGLHPMIAAEVISLALDRCRHDEEPAISRRDVVVCEGRVISRLRIKQYGALPKEGSEAMRQHNEIRATLGLMPIEPKRKAAA